MDPRHREDLIRGHQAAIRQLEAEAADESTPRTWPPDGYYLLWHVVVGMTLGGVGAVVSLLANVFGAPLFGERPMELIRVFLTFPMGARALEVEEGTVLMVGSVLYLLTGALFGIGIHLIFSIFFADANRGKRFLVATGLGLALWIVNFYLILSWLQPLLLGGDWIVRLIPIWVGALTHLAFAWTIAAAEGWGRFETNRGVTV